MTGVLRGQKLKSPLFPSFPVAGFAGSRELNRFPKVSTKDVPARPGAHACTLCTPHTWCWLPSLVTLAHEILSIGSLTRAFDVALLWLLYFRMFSDVLECVLIVRRSFHSTADR